MPGRIDLLIRLLLTVVTQLELWTVDDVSRPPWLQVVSFLLITVPVAWRRHAPLVATAVVAVGFSLQAVAGPAEVLGGFVAAILITYAVAAHDRRGTRSFSSRTSRCSWRWPAFWSRGWRRVPCTTSPGGRSSPDRRSGPGSS